MYSEGEYDLAGFTVGAVEREDLIDGSDIDAGDAIIGIASSGPHSNGYSLIRKVLERSKNSEIDGSPASERLLAPTRIYVKPVLALLQSVDVKGLAHITGGGITENIPRVLQGPLDAEIDTKSWSPGPVFDWLAEHGNIETSEMRRTFNCGVGMVVIVDSADAEKTVQILSEHGESAWKIGQIVTSDAAPSVRYV
jgi:phosphoribosylformylglycinamidine cyclo-ligase